MGEASSVGARPKVTHKPPQGIAAALQRVRLLISIESDVRDRAALQAVLDAADPRKDVAATREPGIELQAYLETRPEHDTLEDAFAAGWNAALADRPK